MVEEMDTDRLADRLDEVQVVDIRSDRQFRGGHIPGAENLPFPSLPQRVDGVDWQREVVVACPKGKSSKQAARLIESYEGLPDDATVYNLTGGYREWDGDLATKSSDAAGQRTASSADAGAPDDEGPEAPF